MHPLSHEAMMQALENQRRRRAWRTVGVIVCLAVLALLIGGWYGWTSAQSTAQGTTAMRNIAAFTETGHGAAYPAYASLNDDGTGKLVLTARERGHDGQKSVNIEMSEEEATAFARAILNRIAVAA